MVDLPQPDPTTGLYPFTAKTNSGDVNRFSVGNTTPVRFVDNRTRTPRIVDFGTGPAAAAAAAAAAQATSDDSKGRANWQIQTGDGSGNWSTVGIDTTDKPSLLAQIANIALPLAAGLIPGIGPIAAGLIGAGTSAGLNGLEGNSGNATLMGALTGGLGAGGLNFFGGSNVLSGLTNGSSAAGPAALPADLSTTAPALTGAEASTLPALTGAGASTLPAGAAGALPTALSGLTVTAGPAAAGASALPAALAAGAIGAGAIGAGATPVDGITVTPRPSSVTEPVVAPPVLGPALADIGAATSFPTPTSTSNSTTPTPKQLADIAKLIAAGVIGGSSSTPSGGTSTTGTHTLNPVFSATLPAANSWAINPPTAAQNLDYEHYAQGPEAQFFTDTQRAPGGAGPIQAAPFDPTSAITQDYQNILNRTPDAGGLAFWADQAKQAVAAGVRPQDEINKLVSQFQVSPEGQARQKATLPFDPTSTIVQDYHNALGRAPDAAGLSYWVNQAKQDLAGGASSADEKAKLLQAFATSPEAQGSRPAAMQPDNVATALHGLFSVNPITQGQPTQIDARVNPSIAYATGGNVEREGTNPSRTSFAVQGPGTGRSDSIPAKLSDGEYVMDAETVSMLGDGSSKAGAAKLDRFRANIRQHKGAALAKGRFSANAKAPEAYLSGGRI